MLTAIKVAYNLKASLLKRIKVTFGTRMTMHKHKVLYRRNEKKAEFGIIASEISDETILLIFFYFFSNVNEQT